MSCAETNEDIPKFTLPIREFAKSTVEFLSEIPIGIKFFDLEIGQQEMVLFIDFDHQKGFGHINLYSSISGKFIDPK